MTKLRLLFLLIIFAVPCLLSAGCDKSCTKDSIALAKQEAVTSTVNIPNSNGSTTPVLIRRQGNVWVGPKGEQYTSYPTVEQLKPVYGF